MEKSMEKSVSSVASGNSKLRYPLRSSLRSKEAKPPVPDFSASSVSRRGRVASAVSQSTTVLDLSSKKNVVDRTKPPPRRLSVQTKTTPNGSSSSSVKSSVITSVSETKAKRSTFAKRLNETTPVSNVMRSVTRKKLEDLSSSAYWLSHIKLAESTAKHSISLGFFKLALDAGCEPIDQMKQELKSYALRNKLDGLDEAMKELSKLYNISEETKKIQISETSSVLAEDTIASLNNDNEIQSSFSTPGKSNVTLDIAKDDAVQEDSSAVIESAKEEDKALETRKSLDVINLNQEVVPESEGAIVVQPSDKKRANKKENVAKNNQPVKPKKSLATNSANPKTIPENKSQKKEEKITKPKNAKNQEQNKKSIKKSAAKEGEVKSLKQMKKMENKENTVVVVAGEENHV